MLRAPGSALSTVTRSVAALGDGGHGGDMAGGEELSARRRSRAVTAIVGERDRGGVGDEGECEGVPGGGVELRETPRERRRQPGRVVAWRARRRRGVPPLPTGTRRKATGGGAWWAGPHRWAASTGAGPVAGAR